MAGPNPTATTELSAEQEAVAERIYGLLKEKTDAKLREMARLLAAKRPQEILGPGEFEIRDHLNEMGASLVETALNERAKKGGLSGS